MPDLVQRIQDVHVERPIVIIFFTLGPFLGGGVVVVFTPQAVHQLGNVDLELVGVHLGKLFEGKGPSVETRS